MSSIVIYALAHPNTPGRIRYIGKTEKPLHRRLAEHVAERNRYDRKCKRWAWIRKLVRNGQKPRIWPLELCDSSNWVQRERYWIWLFKPLGLLNGTDGGDGGSGNRGWKWSKDALARISALRKGKISEAQKAHLRAMQASNIGRKHTIESITKIRASNVGKIVTLEQRNKIRATLLKRNSRQSL